MVLTRDNDNRSNGCDHGRILWRDILLSNEVVCMDMVQENMDTTISDQ